MFSTIDYAQSSDQIEQPAEKLLENMITRKNLDLSYDLELAHDIKYLRLLNNSQSPISLLSLDDENYNNIINLMEG